MPHCHPICLQAPDSANKSSTTKVDDTQGERGSVCCFLLVEPAFYSFSRNHQVKHYDRELHILELLRRFLFLRYASARLKSNQPKEEVSQHLTSSPLDLMYHEPITYLNIN